MKKLILILAVLAGTAFAQNAGEYVYSSSTTAVTVQQPATGAKQVAFHAAWVYCASASTATLSWNGTAASATAGTPLKVPGTTSFAAAANVFTASNASGGTTGPVYQVPAGLTYTIDLSLFRMGTTGTGTNVTITTSNTCTISFAWGEQ